MKNSKLFTALAVGALAIGATAPAMADSTSYTNSAPPLAEVPDLSAGMSAPKIDVGSADVKKATVSYSNSIGSADSFSVGALTNIGATASASSTPDYDVTSNASFSIDASTINQVIGTSGTLPDTGASITGVFNKNYTPDSIKNDVTVGGIGTDATIKASAATFTTDVAKTPLGDTVSKTDLLNTGAGSANGGSGGSVGTTTTASANSSQFVSSFAQAY